MMLEGCSLVLHLCQASSEDHLACCMQLPEAERQGVPHHLIDIVDPGDDFSAGSFFYLARQAAEEILQVFSEEKYQKAEVLPQIAEFAASISAQHRPCLRQEFAYHRVQSEIHLAIYHVCSCSMPVCMFPSSISLQTTAAKFHLLPDPWFADHILMHRDCNFNK